MASKLTLNEDVTYTLRIEGELIQNAVIRRAYVEICKRVGKAPTASSLDNVDKLIITPDKFWVPPIPLGVRKAVKFAEKRTRKEGKYPKFKINHWKLKALEFAREGKANWVMNAEIACSCEKGEG